MGAIESQITSLTIVYSTVYSDADQRKHQSSASLAFVRGIHRGPVNSPHKWPVTGKMCPFDDVIMSLSCGGLFKDQYSWTTFDDQTNDGATWFIISLCVKDKIDRSTSLLYMQRKVFRNCCCEETFTCLCVVCNFMKLKRHRLFSFPVNKLQSRKLLCRNIWEFLCRIILILR